MSLKDAGDIAAIVAAGGILLALLGYVISRRQYRLQVLAEFYQAWSSEQVEQSIVALSAHSPATLNAHLLGAAAGGQWADWHKHLRLFVLLEGIGSLTRGRGVPLKYIDRWIGGAVDHYWQLYEPWIQGVRQQAGSRRTAGANLERLVNRLRKKWRRRAWLRGGVFSP